MLSSLRPLRARLARAPRANPKLRAGLPILALMALLFAVGTSPVHAASITVTSTADNLTAGNGLCTLREAIRNANTNSDTTGGDCLAGLGADVISIPAGTYMLTLSGSSENGNLRGDLDITGSVTLVGAGARSTIIDASTLSPRERVIHAAIFSNGFLTVDGLTIRGGDSSALASL